MKYQFRNYLLIIETTLDTNDILVYKIVSDLVNIMTTYFFFIKLVSI